MNSSAGRERTGGLVLFLGGEEQPQYRKVPAGWLCDDRTSTSDTPPDSSVRDQERA